MTAAEFASIVCAAGLLDRIEAQSKSSYNPVWMSLGLEAAMQARYLRAVLIAHVAEQQQAAKAPV